MKKILLVGSLFTSLTMADIVGGELNLGYYNHAPSGSAVYNGTTNGNTIDVEDTLKWSQENDLLVKAYIEHPVPFLPNLKLGYTSFGHSGNGTLTQDLTWGNQTFTANGNIDSKFDLKMYDITFYYEILDNWLNTDVGLNVKYIDGTVDVTGTTAAGIKSESADFAVPIPMLYAKMRFDIPTTDISLQAEGNYVTYDGHSLYDFEAGVRYTFALGAGIEAGYKAMKLKIDDIDDLSMDTDFSGMYGKVVWDF